MDKKNLLTRCFSGVFIVILFILSIFVLRPLFYVLFSFIAGFMLLEWRNMTKNSTPFYRYLGLILIPVPVISILLISYTDQTGWLLLTYFMIIWSVDVMAMLGGKLIGGPKLAPKLSPKKTISGLITGVLSAIIVVNLLVLLPNYLEPSMFPRTGISTSIFALIIGIIAQMSDLFISYFKRKFHLKDSGSIIPGHGGMLDRFDSIILTAPVVIIILLVVRTYFI
ncbi:MAG: phosphatidate cytidylyltransferase [Rickettsiaceae bacterium]|nr:phosphatidate cytidylyltransferase [Rickettsiaceae bacterium]